MSKRCEFCEREFEGKHVKKVVRGEPHIFCSEACFVIWRYQRPVPNWEAMYDKYTISVTVDVEELIDGGTGGDDHGTR